MVLLMSRHEADALSMPNSACRSISSRLIKMPLFPSQTGELVGTMPVTSAVSSIDSVGLANSRFMTICCTEELKFLDLAGGN